MHLLFTDPSTSPSTELGRVLFGVNGLSTVALYALLGRAGLQTFYDKLLQVPVLNLSIKLIDRAARPRFLRALDPARSAGIWLRGAATSLTSQCGRWCLR
jgi:Na+-translocating ferredoxin:NAD+ oxidoreductase RnfD subunit